MVNKETLPWDLIEEILSRVPPTSLVRFRVVSKQWNALICKDKTFINKHKMTFRFILATKSKIYSVSISPKIEVRELTSDIPGFESQIPQYMFDCNGLLLCVTDKGAVVWNPWLTQTRRIEPEVNQPNLQQFYGMVYGNDNGYKTLASHWKEPPKWCWKIHDFSSDAWKDVNFAGTHQEGERRCPFISSCGISLNGTLYLVAYIDHKTKYLFFLLYFDFSKEKFYKFCDIPCDENHDADAIGLQVFRGDRFSLLKQSCLTKKIEVWVTKNKIRKDGGGDVEWMDFMEVSIPNLPDLELEPSYYIDDKRLVVCSCDETGRAWIYVMEDNKLISKVHIDLVVDPWPLRCTFFPSLLSVPQGPRLEAELQV